MLEKRLQQATAAAEARGDTQTVLMLRELKNRRDGEHGYLSLLMPDAQEMKERVAEEITRRLIQTNPETGQWTDYSGRLVDAIQKDALARVEPLIRERVDEIVTEALTTGYQPTDAFGDPKGEPTTLRMKIAETAQAWLKKRNYRESEIQELVSETTRKVWANELEKEAKAAVDEIKSGLRSKLSDKINAAVASLLKDPGRV